MKIKHIISNLLIIIIVFVFSMFACKSSKHMTQDEQTVGIVIDNLPFEIAVPKSDDTNEEEILIDPVEDQALFNDKPAEIGFREYVYKNLIFSQQMDGMSGCVFVEFSVETDGSVSNAKVIRGVDPLLDAEALRVINASPKWTPAKMCGKPVRVKYVFPVDFRLEKQLEKQ